MAKLLHRRIAQISRKAFPEEACGFVVDGKAVQVANQADEPEGGFLISAQDYLKYSTDVIFHSHPVGDHSFSEHDMVVSANMELTSYLYVVEADRLEILSPAGQIETFEKVLNR
ncbi:MAG: hypothetical protein CL855_01445 [Cryomorphaceae bacterium]|nr:hypothetical protein [Cryomorphaceae bacterium]|tara:strand:- start:1563 stop:1904 length:342 start_codon:yes stop_codon:yes gene_type:complete